MLAAKAFDLDLGVGKAARLQRRGDGVHHAFGPADERGVDVVEVDPLREQRVGLGAVDAAVQQLDVLRLARQHVDQVEAAEVGVLERRQLLLEHHRAGRAVAVDEREAARRLRGQRGLDDRQQRRDAAAGGEAQVVLATRSASSGTLKWPSGGMTSIVSPAFSALVGPGREHAAGRLLDRDAQRAVLHRRTDRIRAAHVLAVDVRAQRQVLALLVAELVAQRVRHGERDGDGVARFALDAGDGQRMEFAHDGATISAA